MKFVVENMTCGHCVRAITNAIQDVDSNATVNIQLADKVVDIQTNTLSAEQIQSILKEEGYSSVASN